MKQSPPPPKGPLEQRLEGVYAVLRDPRRLWREHRFWAIGLLACALALVAGAAVAYQSLKRPPDVRNAEAIERFVAPAEPRETKRPQGSRRTITWPVYGFDRARTRFLPVDGIRPPFRKLWRYTNRPLLEFPPIHAGGRLYFVDNNGSAFALDADSGEVLWERRVGRLNASSPAFARNRLYIVNLVPGHVIKLHARTGEVLWKRPLPGRAESSPLVIGRTIYFGCENGELFALSTVNGNVRWSTQLGGEVKAAPAYKNGKLFVGDYGGKMNAVDAETGELVWQSSGLGSGFGVSGAFYSTPAVAYGRVYSGNNDGRIYSFDSGDGTLAWSYSTGGYAYSGPAVANTKHSPPTVFIGSFDGNVYALDAKDGSERWVRSAGGQVIGSLTAIGDIVYVAEFTEGSTTGFMMRSGRRVFRYPYGTYTPVISDGHRIYLTGYSSITALQPFKHRREVAERRAAPEPKRGGQPARAGRGQSGKAKRGAQPPRRSHEQSGHSRRRPGAG